MDQAGVDDVGAPEDQARQVVQVLDVDQALVGDFGAADMSCSMR